MWCPTTKRRHTEQPPTKWWTPSQDPPVWIPAGDPCDHFRCESNVRSENTDQSRLPSGSACTAEETDWEQTHLAGRETWAHTAREHPTFTQEQKRTSGEDRVSRGVSTSIKLCDSRESRSEWRNCERNLSSFEYSGWRSARWRYLDSTSSLGSFPWYYTYKIEIISTEKGTSVAGFSRNSFVPLTSISPVCICRLIVSLGRRTT